MALELPFGINTVNPTPVDEKYGPYADVATANAAIPVGLRFEGLQVFIEGQGLYGYLNGTADANLAPLGGAAKVQSIWVSDALGDDATAVKYDITKPFKTITAAKNAAVTGDEIIVSAGNYSDNSIFKSGISYYFARYAVVTSTSLPIIQPASGQCIIKGEGSFILDAAAVNSNTVDCAGSNQVLYLECFEIINYSTTSRAVDSGFSVSIVEIDCKYIISHGKNAVIATGGASPDTKFVVRNAIIEVPAVAVANQTSAVVDANRAEYQMFDNCAIVSHSDVYGCVTLRVSLTVVAHVHFRDCIFYYTSTTGDNFIQNNNDNPSRNTVYIFENNSFYGRPSNTGLNAFRWDNRNGRDWLMYFRGLNLSNKPLGDVYNGNTTPRARLRNVDYGFMHDPDYFVNHPYPILT